MPLWLRKFTLNRINKDLKSQSDALKKSASNQNSTSANIGEPVPEHMKKVFKKASKQADYISKKSKK